MAHAMCVHTPGGPEAMSWEEIDIAAPGAGEVLVHNEAIGLNFLDVYFRSGRYPMPTPFVVGHEGAGVIEAVGAGVSDFAIGDRVAYLDPIGAYAQLLLRPASRLVKVPPQIDAVAAASMLLKGVTAEYLVRRTYEVRPGDTILVHAAAGGVGQILCQWANALKATVIGTVGSAAKRELAKESGCAHVIISSEEDVVARVRELTNGKGVPVVYDGVGKDTFAKSLDCLAPRGLMVAFGAASGPIPPLDVQSLAGKGSLYVTRPGIATYTKTTEELRESASALFDIVASGAVKVRPPRTYALADSARAHADLEARKLSGSTVLLP